MGKECFRQGKVEGRKVASLCGVETVCEAEYVKRWNRVNSKEVWDVSVLNPNQIKKYSFTMVEHVGL